MQYQTRCLPIAVVAALIAHNALAQVPRPSEGVQCPNQRAAVGDLGFRAISCSHCSFIFDRDDPTKPRWEFRAEPVIDRIEPGGPAEARLQSGDTIVSIDGHLITTPEGGRRFGQVVPGEPVVLRVRRGNRETDVRIEPDAKCRDPLPASMPSVPGAPVVVSVPPPPPATPRPAAAATPVVAPAPPSILPSGWLGFSLSCSHCGTQLKGGERVWMFSTPPLVESVEPGSPASAAGLESGDRLTHLDGESITSAEGGRRFGALRAGERVRLRLVREGSARETELVVGERSADAPPGATSPSPTARAGPVPRATPTPQPHTVRFTGLVGNAFVQVTGRPVTVTETEGEIVIRSSDITVRIRKTTDGDGAQR